jgi:hypothetical protein
MMRALEVELPSSSEDEQLDVSLYSDEDPEYRYHHVLF